VYSRDTGRGNSREGGEGVDRFSRTMEGSVARAHLAALTLAGRAGKCPIIESNVIRLFERIVKDPIEFDASLPPDVLDLLTRALDKDPAKRLSARPQPPSPRPSRRWKGDPSPSGGVGKRTRAASAAQSGCTRAPEQGG